MPNPPTILRIAVFSPVSRLFDYLPPAGTEPVALAPGQRVRVPFGKSRRIGVILKIVHEASVPRARLKPVLEVLDANPLLPADILALAEWTARYYHHPIGETLALCLPTALRQGGAARSAGRTVWALTPAGHAAPAEALGRAPRQAALLALLRQHPDGLTREPLEEQPGDWQRALRALEQRGWVTRHHRCAGPASGRGEEPPHALNQAQHAAVEHLAGSLGGYAPVLLYGVTGSGKTEVYLQLIARVLEKQHQALVLVPEIGLTPQLVERFRQRFQTPLVVLHSGLSEGERREAWLAARDGSAGIVLGTRSAVFTPLARPGLIIVDEEHDLSYKQQEGVRYCARDLAVVRAARAGTPVVLASATPSLESLNNALEQRYQLLHLPERAGAARVPKLQLLDVRGMPMEDGLSRALLERVAEHLGRGEQVLLFLNRRGFAPTLLCHECGWVAQCQRCDAHMTLHQERQRLVCHHCGAEQPLASQCPACGGVDLRALGQGTERIHRALQDRLPDCEVVRIDRDSTRRKGALENKLQRVRNGGPAILVGTQMLAKGHHFPSVTLVGVVDTDQGLFSADFRGTERMAQLLLQVAGRAGRAHHPGHVLIQTHHPQHPLLQALVEHDYERFARTALAERREACLPPFSYLALVRAASPGEGAPYEFLNEAREQAEQHPDGAITLLGPVPAPMEKRQGRYRAQLLIQTRDRPALHRFLDAWLPQVEALKTARRVRWSVDVDPLDMM